MIGMSPKPPIIIYIINVGFQYIGTIGLNSATGKSSMSF